jgi:DNA-binding transcriptional MocR family regulator
MTIWTPQLPTGRPLYLAIADAIDRAIQHGPLLPGERLPTQRELAERLGIALTTVTRGYGEAERRGLVRGEVGRGTYVNAAVSDAPGPEAEGPVDLRPNTLLPLPLLPELRESLAALMRDPTVLELFDYGPHRGRLRHREAGAAWLARLGMEVRPDELLVTSGAQHAMMVALATITEPGDVVLAEEVTYAGMKSLASLLKLRLEPLPLDKEGLLPDALRAQARRHKAVALYAMPTIQNPTSALMSEGRRREVANAVNDAGLTLIEDDSYGYLDPGPPRLSTFCERGFHIAGTSKSLLPALRVAFLHGPANTIERAEARVAATTYLVSPLMTEAVARWLADGTAERVMAWKREEARARQGMAARAFADFDYRSHEKSAHGWLLLPEPWSARDFVRQAAERGALVTPADVFAVGRDNVPHAVRICLGPARSRRTLERGLAALAATLEAGPEPVEVVI